MNKSIFTSKESTIMRYLINKAINDNKRFLLNPMNTDLINSYIQENIKTLKIILKKLNNPNYKGVKYG